MSRTCARCFRELGIGESFCRRCFQRETPLARIVVLLGVAGVPIFLAGMLSLNARLSMIGAAVCAAAVVVHIAIAMR